MENENTAMVYVPQWQEKIGWRFFPHVYVDPPELKNAKDCVIVRTLVYLSWLDRVKLLLSGRLEVDTKTVTEHEVGAQATNSGAFVRAPEWLERRE